MTDALRTRPRRQHLNDQQKAKRRRQGRLTILFLNVLDRKSKRVLIQPQRSTVRLSDMQRYVRSLVDRPHRFLCSSHERHSNPREQATHATAASASLPAQADDTTATLRWR